ncbi:unnamed protein product [Oppiella nova]|uniref:Uncharacterized protein n=1 Tax=Oppiella nova TaxID=334625 RepID=A0A7R9LAS4_9ACAR|nr:unnamed protein product [Oppiella nova]CAG2161682.1 unnamed protein product [Oppiella nova]
MDLNIIVFKNKTFDSKQTIAEKLSRALNLGFRTIGVTVDVDANDIQNIPKPPVIELQELGINWKDVCIKTRLNVRVDEHIQTHRLPISKGIGIEINYGNSLLDQTARRSLFGFSQLLVEKTRSRNIILSSGAETSFALRSPKDVTYL